MTSEVDEPAVELKKQDLETLLCQKLRPNLKVLSFTSCPLTQPGDNYGSTILDVEVVYQLGQDQIAHKLPLVAKLVPPSDFLRKAFNIDVTFKKEVRTYMLVSPEYYNLQKEKGISENEMVNVFPEFYGARTNQQGNMEDMADFTAVLLMENLKTSGYHTGNRRLGLNFKHMELGVTQLAHFHAVTIALKIQKPKIFADTVLKACEKFNLGGDFNEEEHEKFVSCTVNFVNCIPECKPYIESIEKNLRNQMKQRTVLIPPKEPFATLVHNDFWINNMMFKYNLNDDEKNQFLNYDTPIGMKFVDFQVPLYDSPVRDLLFFLFTSSEVGVIEKHFDLLMHLYHKEFIEFLKKLECDTDPFSLPYFEGELNTYAPKEFSHILFMIKIVSTDSTGMADLKDIDFQSMFESNMIGDLYANKVKLFVQTFANKGWI